MANENSIAEGPAGTTQLTVRTIRLADIGNAMALGFADFKETPTHVLFLIVIYPLVTLVFARISAGYDVLP